jgi:hypothetical protein
MRVQVQTIAATAILFAATFPALALEPIGVAVCDDFLAKYETCIMTKIAPERRDKLKGNVEQLHKTWSGLAGDPNMKGTLENICTQVAEGTKKNATNSVCEW